jgi:hypothetical protein
MAVASITLEDGSTIEGIEVPEWLAPHVTTYMDAMAAMQTAAAELAEAVAVHAAAETVLLAKQQAFTSAEQALNDITANIANNLGGN